MSLAEGCLRFGRKRGVGLGAWLVVQQQFCCSSQYFRVDALRGFVFEFATQSSKKFESETKACATVWVHVVELYFSSTRVSPLRVGIRFVMAGFCADSR